MINNPSNKEYSAIGKENCFDEKWQMRSTTAWMYENIFLEVKHKKITECDERKCKQGELLFQAQQNQ